PDACSFDPATIQYSAGTDNDQCLTPPQVETMRALYDGIPHPEGGRYLPGWTYGSEMQMAALIMGERPFPVAYTYFSMLVFGNQPDWDWKSFDYYRDALMGRGYGASILDVPADGLQAFFARGGKLLLSHGWNDGLIPADNTLRFWGALGPSLTPAQASTQARLFMAPGMDHCSGGIGASEFDTLGVLDDWATSGTAPEMILARRPAGAPPGPPGAPAAPAREALSRPLCAYPAYARYNGSGDPAAASSFTCVTAD